MALVIARRLQQPKAFKGWYLLNQLLGNQSRMTHDIDFSISDKIAYVAVKELLKEIGDTFCNNHSIASYTIKEDISSQRSGGVDFYSDDGTKILGVGVGLHSLEYGIIEYNFEISVLSGFSIERMLADKIISILSKKRFRRTKDLYDVWVLTNNFDFDARLVYQFIDKRGNAEWQNIPFSDTVLVEYAKAWNKLILQTPTARDLEKPDFAMVLHRFNNIATVLKEGINLGIWKHLQLGFSER